MYYNDYKVDFLYTKKLITKNSFVLLPDQTIGKVIGFSSGICCLTKDGEKKYTLKEIKPILLFATNKSIFKSNIVIYENEFFVVDSVNDNEVTCLNHLEEVIKLPKEKLKRFNGIIKTEKLFQVGDSISGYESYGYFNENLYPESIYDNWY